MRVVQAAPFLGSVLGLFAAKLGEELVVSVLWVELARTIILSIKLRWRNRVRVDLNRDHRLSRDTEMPTSDISFQKNNDAVARLAVYIG